MAERAGKGKHEKRTNEQANKRTNEQATKRTNEPTTKRTNESTTNIDIKINLDRLTVGDMFLMEELSTRGDDPSSRMEMLRFLDRIVEGGIMDLPLTSLSAVMEALRAELDKLTADVEGN